MIELTTEQKQAIHESGGKPVRLIDPVSRETFLLVPLKQYEKLRDYDDGPWTEEEIDALAGERAEMAGWECMEDYQDYKR